MCMHVCVCCVHMHTQLYNSYIHIIIIIPSGAAVAEELDALFAGDLNPVAPKAQKKVPVPEGWVSCYDVIV